MYQHHQFGSAAAAAAAYPHHSHQFYQQYDLHNSNSNETHGQQQQHQQQPQQQHQQLLQQQQQQQQQPNQQWNRLDNQHQHQQAQSQQQQPVYSDSSHQSYYAMINALNGYHAQGFEHHQALHHHAAVSSGNCTQQHVQQQHHHPVQQHQQANYVSSCDTNSVEAAVASTFAAHLNQQQPTGHLQQDQQQHSPNYGDAAYAQLQSSVNRSSLTGADDMQRRKELVADSSAINQLQALAMFAPEAAAAVSTFPGFYQGITGPRMQHSSSVIDQNSNSNVSFIGKTSKIGHKQRQAATSLSNSKSRPQTLKRSINTTSELGPSVINGTQASQQQSDIKPSNPASTTTTTSTTSRSQRRYAGRTSCDCPNCVELERQRRLGFEIAPAGLGSEAGSRKLMHVCHHAGCGKEYEKTSHLRAHLRWHTERSSACRHPGCGQRFGRTDELRRHMRTHHAQPTQSSPALA